MDDLDHDRLTLLEDKLGRLRDWKPPELVETFGPHDPSVFHAFGDRVDQLRAQITERLVELSDDQIEVLGDPSLPDPSNLRANWADYASAEVKKLEGNEPPWFAGGLGHPEYQADLKYWARMESFSLSEATCLSLGIDPKHFTSDKLDRYASGNVDDLWPSLTFLVQRHEMLQRKFGRSSGIRDRSIDALALIVWARKVDLEMPHGFREDLERYHLNRHGDAGGTYQPKKPDKREIYKIAQLFTAMVMDSYGYRPGAARNKATKDVANLAASMGLEISDDTIRKYLRIGGEFIPEDWTP